MSMLHCDHLKTLTSLSYELARERQGRLGLGGKPAEKVVPSAINSLVIGAVDILVAQAQSLHRTFRLI